MSRFTASVTMLSIGALAAVSACSSDTALQPSNITGVNPAVSYDQGNGLEMRLEHARACPGNPHDAACHALVAIDATGEPFSTRGPSGYGPVDLRAAYNLSSVSLSGGTGQTVAIVDAYDDGNAESDLAVYRHNYGLPVCSTANGCFRKVNQTGGTVYPRGDAGWAEEISLDLDMVSAICPNCHILLVEATSPTFANLSAAVDKAVALGANVVSNSYGGNEYSSETSDESHYNHPGVAITVSSGDSGYGVEFPASSQYVTAVGGTTLTKSGSAFTEKVWNGAGSGCSAYITKPSWQTDASCTKRTVADVSAVADPNTGVAVYDTYKIRGGWLVFGGTSVAAPIIGSVYALAANEASINYGSFSYSNTGSLHDILTGSNGSCNSSYLCTAKAGYDGPTGNGTPNGTGAF
jgi:subtilase family serine protease